MINGPRTVSCASAVLVACVLGLASLAKAQPAPAPSPSAAPTASTDAQSYDGQWTGTSAPVGSCATTPSADITIKDGIARGQLGQKHYAITGLIDGGGNFKGKINASDLGVTSLEGKSDGNKIVLRYWSPTCGAVRTLTLGRS